MKNWKYIQAVHIGTAHSQLELLCQDKAMSAEVETPEGNTFVAIISDGAGSASHSHIGSNIATQLTMRYIINFLESGDSIVDLAKSVSKSTVQDWLWQMQQQIIEVANEEGISKREYACTLTVAVVQSNASLFFQVGDGSIVFGKESSYELAFWPMQHEYANVTDFVTGNNVLDALRIKLVEGSVDRVAIMSDGLQRLALVFASKTAYPPFFQAMFQPLQNHPEVGFSQFLSHALCQFLASPIVCEKTDDDKSLILGLLDKATELSDNETISLEVTP